MVKIVLELDDVIADRLRAEAEAQGRRLDEFLRERIEAIPAAARDPFRGVITDERFIDDLIEGVMHAREAEPLRAADAGEGPVGHGHPVGDRQEQGSCGRTAS